MYKTEENQVAFKCDECHREYDSHKGRFFLKAFFVFALIPSKCPIREQKKYLLLNLSEGQIAVH